jgi:hypothetical protein
MYQKATNSANCSEKSLKVLDTCLRSCGVVVSPPVKPVTPPTVKPVTPATVKPIVPKTDVCKLRANVAIKKCNEEVDAFFSSTWQEFDTESSIKTCVQRTLKQFKACKAAKAGNKTVPAVSVLPVVKKNYAHINCSIFEKQDCEQDQECITRQNQCVDQLGKW